VKLKRWIELNEQHEQVNTAVETKNEKSISKEICSYVSIATGISEDSLGNLYWLDVANQFAEILISCVPDKKFPILRSSSSEQNQMLDYEGREWYLWAHMFADAYGWSMEYIGDLELNDAFGMMQEVLIEKQLEKEWSYGLSEVAYPYDQATKKSRFKPLNRPNWMKEKEKIEEPKKVKIHKNMLPVGNVIRMDDAEHGKGVKAL